MELLDQCREKPCLLAHLGFRHLGGLGAAGVAVFVPNLTTRRNASAVQNQALACVVILCADRERDGGGVRGALTPAGTAAPNRAS